MAVDDIARLGIEVTSEQVVQATRRLDRLETQSGKTERATDALRTSAKRAALAFGVMAAASAAVAAAFAIAKTKAFEKSVSDLAAITGAAGDDLKFMSDKAKEFGATTTLSASQAVEAFKLIASAKPDLLENAAALAMVTKETITLAEAAGIGLPDAANALGNALNQFGAGAEEASRFINILAAGSKFGASSIEDINAALVNVGGTASTVGLSFEETNAALQVMAASGIKASEAGTGLRSVLLNLEKQNNDKFKPSVVGVSDAFKNLKAANLSTTDQMDLFGKLMFNQGNTLIKNAEKIETLTDKLTDTTTAYEQAAIRVDNLDGDLKKLNSVLEAVALTIGEMNTGVLRDFIQGITTAAGRVNFFFKLLDEGTPEGVAERYQEVGDRMNWISERLKTMKGDWVPDWMQKGRIAELTEEYKVLGEELSTLQQKMSRQKGATVPSIDKPSKPDEGVDTAAVDAALELELIQARAEAVAILMGELNAEKLGIMADYFEELGVLAEQAGMDEESRAIDRFDKELTRIEEFRDLLMEQGLLDAEAQAEIDKAKENAEAIHGEEIQKIRDKADKIALKHKSDLQKLMGAIDKGMYGDALQMAGTFADQLKSLGGKAFEDNKGIQMAIAGIKGLGTIMNAIEHGSQTGGVYGAIAEGAVATAMVGAQIMKIQNASVSGASISGPSGGGAPVDTATPYDTGSPVPGAPQEEERAGSNLQVIIQLPNDGFFDPAIAQQIADTIAPYQQNAIDRGAATAEVLI